MNKLEAGPAAKGRDDEGQMRRSHVCFFGLVVTCDVAGTHMPNAKTGTIFQMGPRKKKSRISEIPRQGRYRTNIKLNKQKTNMNFCIRTSMPAEYWYVPRVSYMCRNSIPPEVCSF